MGRLARLAAMLIAVSYTGIVANSANAAFTGTWTGVGQAVENKVCGFRELPIVVAVNGNEVNATIEHANGRKRTFEGEVDDNGAFNLWGKMYIGRSSIGFKELRARLTGRFVANIFYGTIHGKGGYKKRNCRFVFEINAGFEDMGLVDLDKFEEPIRRASSNTETQGADGYEGTWIGGALTENSFSCGFSITDFTMVVSGDNFVATGKDAQQERKFEGTLDDKGGIRSSGTWSLDLPPGNKLLHAKVAVKGTIVGEAFAGTLIMSVVKDKPCRAMIAMSRLP